MPVDLSDRLVVAVASSALFDLTESDQVFRERGAQQYEQFQIDHLHDQFSPGPAFQFVKRLLALNQIQHDLVEVLVVSRNSPASGLRIMESVRQHGLGITRAIFRSGKNAHEFMPLFNVSLFLSGNRADVDAAIAAGLPAGHVLPTPYRSREEGSQLRIAFDFDGVLADDSAERVYQESDSLDQYFQYEQDHAAEPLKPGPLQDFLSKINRIQDIERARHEADETYERRVRVSLVTARNAPAHERAIRSLMSWGLGVDDAFFLGGIEKTGVLNVLQPHIFFDDQLRHLNDLALEAPAVHIPFGLHNLADPTSSPPRDA